jgi:shikimate dehydrogenase
VTIYNRTTAKGVALANDVGAAFGGDLRDLKTEGAEILVNATSAEMRGEGAVPVSDSVLESVRIVMDILVRPRQTELLVRAAAAGCETVEGVRMLVYQGAFAFERFTGQPAPLEPMFAAVESLLG